MSARAVAYVNLTLAMIIVGSSAVAGSVMVAVFPVHLASLLRFGLACLILLPLVRWKEGGLPRLSLRTHALLLFQALCGSYLFTVLFLNGLKLTSPASAGIITSSTPACIAAIGWIFLGERPGRRVLGGIACCMAGVMTLNLAGGAAGAGAAGARDAPDAAGALLGNLLVLGAVFFESLFLLLRKGIREPLSSLSASMLVSVYGFALFLPLGVVEAAGFDFSAAGAGSWLAVGYYGAFVTVLAYLFWFTGIVRAPATVAGLFTGVMPVSAVTLAVLVLGEPLRWQQLAGCCGVLAGIALLYVRKR